MTRNTNADPGEGSADESVTHDKDSIPNMMEHALAYARHGLYVIPIWWPLDDGTCACGDPDPKHGIGKHPAIQNGQNAATIDEDRIRNWWGQLPEANIGLCLEPSRLIAIDCDLYKGDGERLEKLTEQHGPLPTTIEQVSGSGEGGHLIYRAPGIPIRGDVDGVTMRGRNYIVVAPSKHKSGKRYAWEPGNAPGELEPAHLPKKWIEALTKDVSLGDAKVPDEESEAEWLSAIPKADRIAAMREHVERETGERKGTSEPGKMFNIARTCVRGFAVRDQAAVFDALMEYNKRCVPNYEPERLGEIIASAYEKAIEPAWGSALLARATLGKIAAEFTADKHGVPYVTQHNVKTALQKLGVTVAFDELAQRKLLRRNGVDVIVQDHHVVSLRMEIDRTFGFLVPDRFFRDVVTTQAHANTFHPVRDYLDGLTWDKTPRIERWLIDAGASDTPYVRAISRLPLVAAVRRARKPGAPFHEMLIIEGEQGVAEKSSALAALCPDPKWFTDDLHLNSDTKKMIEQTSGKWIVEAGELKGMSKSDKGALKSYLSRAVDEARMAYGEENSIRPRQFIIIGTTNDDEYLDDPTGNRRFWPVKVARFDLPKLRSERDQIWAEACVLEQTNPADVRMDQSLWAVAAIECYGARLMMANATA